MDEKKLTEIWEQMTQETFNDFIKENVGYEAKGDKPACYGSGDDKPWCIRCNYQATC